MLVLRPQWVQHNMMNSSLLTPVGPQAKLVHVTFLLTDELMVTCEEYNNVRQSR